MISNKKSFLSAAVLAIAACILAPADALAVTGDVPELQILNTSALYAAPTNYDLVCTVTNVSTSAVSVYMDVIDSSGTVQASSGPTAVSIPAGTLVQISATGFSGYARCRVRTQIPSGIRANLIAFFNNTNGASQIVGTAEAR